MIVVAIIGLLSAIALPNFMKARETSQADTCISNLRQIDSAVQQWALENNKTATDTVTAANVRPYIGRGTAGVLINTDLKCPASGTYAVTDVQSKPTCTLSTATLKHELAL